VIEDVPDDEAAEAAAKAGAGDDDEEEEEVSILMGGGKTSKSSSKGSKKKGKRTGSSKAEKGASSTGAASTPAAVKPQFVLRRLVFMSNRNAIQTEAKITVRGDAFEVDSSHLAFPYHQAMVAALALLPSAAWPSSSASASTAATRVTVVGLGGGSLPLFLAAQIKSLDVTCVELDPTMASVAQSHFGFKVRPDDAPPAEASLAGASRLIVGDGLDEIKRLADFAPADSDAKRPHVIILDVDSKDLRAGLSFPPAAFVAKPFLQQVRTALHPEHGLLLVNLGARSKALYAGVIASLISVFGAESCAVIPMDTGDLNSVVAVGPAVAAAKAAKTALSDDKAWLAQITSRLATQSSAAEGMAKEWIEKLAWQ
jgi:spermidine synthase